MTIHLPAELERFVHDQVVAGRYRSEDDVIREVHPEVACANLTLAQVIVY